MPAVFGSMPYIFVGSEEAPSSEQRVTAGDVISFFLFFPYGYVCSACSHVNGFTVWGLHMCLCVCVWRPEIDVGRKPFS